MKKMERIIAIMMMVMLVLSISIGHASCDKEDLNHYFNYIWFQSVCDDFDEAFSNGESCIALSNWMLYDGIIYMYNSGLGASGLGYSNTIDRAHIKEIEKYIENLFIEDGASFPQVNIRFVGQDEWEQDIYEITIMMMENINNFEGERTGSGFIEENFEYYGMKVLGHIY